MFKTHDFEKVWVRTSNGLDSLSIKCQGPDSI